MPTPEEWQEYEKEAREEYYLRQDGEINLFIEEGRPWPEVETPGVPIYSLAELLDLQFEKPSYFVDPIIPSTGITLFAGASGSLKTAVVSDLFLSILDNRKWLGHYSVEIECNRMLYLDGEVGLQVIQQRLKSMNAPHSDRLDYIYKQWRVEDDKDYQLLQQIIREGSYDLIVVDSLSAMHKLEERNDTTVFVMQQLRSLADLANCPMLVLANFNKSTSEKRELLERISGPSVYRNKSSSIITLRRFGGKKKLKARFQLQKNWLGGEGEARTIELSKKGEYLVFSSEEWIPPSQEDDAGEEEGDSMTPPVLSKEQLIRMKLMLKFQDGPIVLSEFRETLRSSEVKELGSVIDQLVDEGQVRRTLGSHNRVILILTNPS